MAWGTGSGTASTTDTALFTEDTTTGYARVNSTTSRVTTAQTNDTYQAVATIVCQASGGLSITEAGLLDALTAGNLFIHSSFTAIALNLNDSITFTVKLQFA